MFSKLEGEYVLFGCWIILCHIEIIVSLTYNNKVNPHKNPEARLNIFKQQHSIFAFKITLSKIRLKITSKQFNV